MIRKTSCFVALALGLMMTGWSMPSRSDLKKVQSTVNELMADDIAAMKGGKKTPADAAAKALEYAGVATDEASKFLLYKGAFGLFVQGGKYDEAIAALDALNANVKNVPDKVVADIVREKLKKISKKDGGAIFEYYARVDRRMRYGEEKTNLEKRVKANPSDKDAQRSLAQTHVALGDWSAALASFASLGGDEAKAAKAEQGGKLAEAADFWWGYSVAGDEDLQDEFRVHAASLYAQAVKDGKLNGLKKALAEKRIAEFAPKAAASAPQPAVAANREPAPKAEEPTAPAPAAPTASAANGKPIVLDLGGGEKLEMLPCPAGEFTMGYEKRDPRDQNVPHQVKISRPFYLAKFPMTRGQWAKATKQSVSGGSRWFSDDKTLPITDIYAQEEIWHVGRDLTKRFRRQLPEGYVVRLPTEAEWEYALKAGGTDEFHSRTVLTIPELETVGPGPLRAGNLYDVIKGRNGSFAMLPMPCGKYKPNRWGFHDMLGNVWEMTLDCAEYVERREMNGMQAKSPDGWFKDETDPLCWLYARGKQVESVCRGGCGYVIHPERDRRKVGFVMISHRHPSGQQFPDAAHFRGFRLAIGPDLLTERNLPQPK